MFRVHVLEASTFVKLAGCGLPVFLPLLAASAVPASDSFRDEGEQLVVALDITRLHQFMSDMSAAGVSKRWAE